MGIEGCCLASICLSALCSSCGMCGSAEVDPSACGLRFLRKLCRCCGLSPTSTTPVCPMLPAAGSCSAPVSLLSSLGLATPCMCLTTSSSSASALMLTTRQQYRRCWRQDSNPRVIVTAGRGVLAHSDQCAGSVNKLLRRARSCAVDCVCVCEVTQLMSELGTTTGWVSLFDSERYSV